MLSDRIAKKDSDPSVADFNRNPSYVMFKRGDIIVSLLIGEFAALLMVAVGQNLNFPPEVSRYVLFLPFAFPVFTLAAMLVGAAFSRVLPIVYQFVKFALTGGLNFLIDLGAFNLLSAATGISSGVLATAFKGASFIVANISSFFFNKYWTFSGSDSRQAGLQFIEFFAVSLGGFLVNVGTFAAVNDFIGPQGGLPEKIWASVAVGFAAVAGLLWNFFGYKFFVFRKTENRI